MYVLLESWEKKAKTTEQKYKQKIQITILKEHTTYMKKSTQNGPYQDILY